MQSEEQRVEGREDLKMVESFRTNRWSVLSVDVAAEAIETSITCANQEKLQRNDFKGMKILSNDISKDVLKVDPRKLMFQIAYRRYFTEDEHFTALVDEMPSAVKIINAPSAKVSEILKTETIETKVGTSVPSVDDNLLNTSIPADRKTYTILERGDTGEVHYDIQVTIKHSQALRNNDRNPSNVVNASNHGRVSFAPSHNTTDTEEVLAGFRSTHDSSSFTHNPEIQGDSQKDAIFTTSCKYTETKSVSMSTSSDETFPLEYAHEKFSKDLKTSPCIPDQEKSSKGTIPIEAIYVSETYCESSKSRGESDNPQRLDEEMSVPGRQSLFYEDPQPTAASSEARRTAEVSVLALISGIPFNGKVLKDQQNAMTILDAKRINYSILDGADPANKEERNSLFAISGLWAKYPQFFLVRNGKRSFYGNMDALNEANEAGTLVEDLAGFLEEDVSIESMLEDCHGVIERHDVTEKTLGYPDTNNRDPPCVFVLVLIFLQSSDRHVTENQTSAVTILKSRGIRFSLLDGSNPANREERNQLFNLSGHWDKYPQFFLVRGSTKFFYGDMQAFSHANETGILLENISKTLQTDSAKSESVDEFEGEYPKAIQKHSTSVETVTAVAQSTISSVLVLVSRRPFYPKILHNQQYAFTILDSKGIKYTVLDGADPANKDKRNSLFALSGLWAKYPQFFVLDESKTQFFGDIDAFNDANENGTLESSLGSSVSDTDASENASRTGMLDVMPTERGALKDVYETALTESDLKVVPRELMTKALGEQLREISDREMNKQPAVKEKSLVLKNVDVKPTLLVVVSRQTVDMEILTNQQRALDILDSSGIKYCVVDEEKRNIPLALSNPRTKTPHVFLHRDGAPVFFGDIKTLKEANDRGSLACELGIEPEKTGIDLRPWDTEKFIDDDEQNEILLTGKENFRNVEIRSATYAVDTLPVTAITVLVGTISHLAEHVVEYSVHASFHLSQPLTLTFAGRDLSTLCILKDGWEKKRKLLLATTLATGKGRCVFDVYLMSSGNIEDYRQLAARTRIVLDCEEPSSLQRCMAVAACVEFGTNYVDATSDVSWASELRAQHGGAAAATSDARIISLCGVASDLAVFSAVSALRNEPLNKYVDIAQASTRHAATGAHVAFHKKGLQQMALKESSDAHVIANPALKKDPTTLSTMGKRVEIGWFSQLRPFHTHSLITRMSSKVVHASAISLKYGASFRYQERFLPLGLPAQLAALVYWIAVRLPLFGPLLSWVIFRMGPCDSDIVCAAASYEVYAEVCSPVREDGHMDMANTYMKFQGDPCHWVTAQCASEAALSLLINNEDLPARSRDGFGTPSELLGEVLLQRLRESPVRPIEFFSQIRKNTTQSASRSIAFTMWPKTRSDIQQNP